VLTCTCARCGTTLKHPVYLYGRSFGVSCCHTVKTLTRLGYSVWLKDGTDALRLRGAAQSKKRKYT
jgi:hypothetical protein